MKTNFHISQAFAMIFYNKLSCQPKPVPWIVLELCLFYILFNNFVLFLPMEKPTLHAEVYL